MPKGDVYNGNVARGEGLISVTRRRRYWGTHERPRTGPHLQNPSPEHVLQWDGRKECAE